MTNLYLLQTTPHASSYDLLVIVNILIIISTIWGGLKLIFQLGRISSKIDNQIAELRTNMGTTIKEQQFVFDDKLMKLKQLILETRNIEGHKDELSQIKIESVLSTITADIKNIVTNIDDIELFLMKTAKFNRRRVSLIHGKKRKLREEDLLTANDEEVDE